MADNKRPNPRAIAWHCLQRWAKGGIFAETLINRETTACPPADRAMVQAITYGVLRNLRWLEHLRHTLRTAHLEESARWLLFTGLCQLFILGQPEHAAVCESVNLAPRRMRGLINALLRQSVRQRDSLLAERATLPPGIRYSMPDWLVERWQGEWGEEETLRLLDWMGQPPPVYVRLNPLNPIQPPADWCPLEEAPGWYRLPGGLPKEALQAGQLYIADPSTRYSVELLAPQPGERVLDACAAPGGKSAAILGLTGGNVELVATDAAEHRLPQLKENLQRAGGKDIRVSRHDWTKPCPTAYQAAFDAVLLDVPCSNSGVLQRRVDARWRLEPGSFSRLASLQGLILEQAATAVRPGGRLVYSTCSIDRQENRSVVEAFLARHPEYCLQQDYLALPHREKADGAYAALLQRCRNV